MAARLVKLTTREFAPTLGICAVGPMTRPTLNDGGSADCGETYTLVLTMPLRGRFGLAIYSSTVMSAMTPLESSTMISALRAMLCASVSVTNSLKRAVKSTRSHHWLAK